MSHLRSVDARTGSPIEDQIRALAEQAIAEGAVTFVATWTPAGNEQWRHRAIPDCDGVLAGMTIRLARHVESVILPPLHHTDG